MATLHIPEENRTITEFDAVRAYLGGIGINQERWEPTQAVPADASAQEVLATYSAEIDRLKARGGYVTADVIDVSAATPGLDAMLNKFNSEHWHDEDEVRCIIEGRGLFHIRPQQGSVVSITVEAGDLIRVPRGTLHWFDLCRERRIRAIRLFSGSFRLDTALHAARRGQKLSGSLLWAELSAGASTVVLSCLSLSNPYPQFCSTSRAPQPRLDSSIERFSHSPPHTSSDSYSIPVITQ
jgi:1,2-dihydroxy-3-keto-5-methylthiopentene dioxygenase